MNGETNNSLNNTSDRNSNDSCCRNNKTKHRKKNVIWFNPPFCKLSTIIVGKYFLRLIDKKKFNGNNPLKNFLTGKQLQSVILALIIYTKSLATKI